LTDFQIILLAQYFAVYLQILC